MPGTAGITPPRSIGSESSAGGDLKYGGKFSTCRAKPRKRYMHRLSCQILVASPSAAGSKSDSAERKFRPPSPNGLQNAKSWIISREIGHCPPIFIGRRRGGWRREKNQTYLHFQPVQLWPTKIAARPCIE